ncbi:MAG: acetyl-CoA decarbonylase/synthase complex subunit gamma [Deltaproteobacteria bacterium]|nr:MAG: acetyl-CoA decarbonylase/synthase complex subunit gamma [Deltaproteobacteria bacterium]
MGLTGIQIFKLLPKTNCKECGHPTCLAFAMALATGKADLSSCPYVSDEAKEQLAEASAPPVRPIQIGAGDRSFKLGGETVLFRHEKTFVSPPGLGALVASDTDEGKLAERLKVWDNLQFERVGLNLRPELVAIKDVGGDSGRFATLAKKVVDESDFCLVLMSEDVGTMRAGIDASIERRPAIYAATKNNVDDMGALAKEKGLPLAVKADDMDGLMGLTNKLAGMGLKDLILDAGSRTVRRAFEDQVWLRREAIMKKNRALGFPTITFPCEMADSLDKETVIAAMFIAKYAGIIILSDFIGESLFPLLVERLNIYTDPQRPMTVKQGIYEINGPDENSPVCITTNFSLTYFIVSSEIEASRVPTWLLIMDTEGLSVMTAWAAGKFVGDAVGVFVNKCGILDKVRHRKLIISGYAAAISGDLEEEVKGSEVLVGPRDAAHIPKFLKEFKA